jgi:hypothetical protein
LALPTLDPTVGIGNASVLIDPTIGIGNASVPIEVLSGAIACRFDTQPATHRLHLLISERLLIHRAHIAMRNGCMKGIARQPSKKKNGQNNGLGLGKGKKGEGWRFRQGRAN